MEQVTKIILHPRQVIGVLEPLARRHEKNNYPPSKPSRSKNIIHVHGYLCDPYARVVVGTQAQLTKLERRMMRDCNTTWELRLYEALIDLSLEAAEFERVACFYDETAEGHYRAEYLPWEVIATHDPDLPAAHVARELNKMCRDNYMVASTSSRHSGEPRQTQYRFRDQHDATLAKLFFS